MSELTRIDNEYTPDLNNKLFTLYRGWDQTLATDLVRNSREEAMTLWTPDDASRRFHDVDAANRWHSDGQRSVYSLYGKGLAGVIWYDVRLHPDVDAKYTFALRMYDEARGKKLSQAFMKAAHIDFAQRKGNPAVWLDVALDNDVAIHVYDQFGYEKVRERGDRQVMVYPPER